MQGFSGFKAANTQNIRIQITEPSVSRGVYGAKLVTWGNSRTQSAEATLIAYDMSDQKLRPKGNSFT
jgi:hypothetical protein